MKQIAKEVFRTHGLTLNPGGGIDLHLILQTIDSDILTEYKLTFSMVEFQKIQQLFYSAVGHHITKCEPVQGEELTTKKETTER